MERINGYKAALAALLAMLTALWGWFGWLVFVWAALMVTDYLSGSAAAARLGQWNSQTAREGLWHKGGMILIVGVSALADFAISLVLGNMSEAFPFHYSVLICPIVVVWYIITEIGSIIENAAAMGAPVPPWLMKLLKVTANIVDQAGDNLSGTRDGTWKDTDRRFPLRQPEDDTEESHDETES